MRERRGFLVASPEPVDEPRSVDEQVDKPVDEPLDFLDFYLVN